MAHGGAKAPSVSQFASSGPSRSMWKGKGGAFWGAGVLCVVVAACSASGVVLETRRGEPSPPNDGGVKSPETDGATATVSEAVTPAPRSGTQVEVTAYFAAGQPLAVKDIRDKTHDVSCQIGLAEDGNQRCLPLPGGVVYRDAHCTDAVVVQDRNQGLMCPAAALPKILAYQLGLACPAPALHVASPGASVPKPDTVYEWNSGLCSATQSHDESNFFEVIPRPPGDWVSYQRTVTTITPSLGIETWNGEDGSRFAGHVLLLPSQDPCTPIDPASLDTIVGSGVNRCIPTARQYEATGALFSDPTCAGDAVTLTPDCQPLLLSVLNVSDGTQCGGLKMPFFDVGKVVPNSGVYTDQLGPCRVAESILGGFTSYARGTPVDVTRYPALELVPHGEGPVQALVWESGGKMIGIDGPPTNAFAVDAKSGAGCASVAFDDGFSRCVPLLEGIVPEGFADPSCMQPLYLQPADIRGCGASEVPMWIYAGSASVVTSCGTTSPPHLDPHARPVLGQHTGPVYTTNPMYAADSNACSRFDIARFPFGPDAGSAGSLGIAAFYDLGAPVDTSTLFTAITTGPL